MILQLYMREKRVKQSNISDHLINKLFHIKKKGINIINIFRTLVFRQTEVKTRARLLDANFNIKAFLNKDGIATG